MKAIRMKNEGVSDAVRDRATKTIIPTVFVADDVAIFGRVVVSSDLSSILHQTGQRKRKMGIRVWWERVNTSRQK